MKLSTMIVPTIEMTAAEQDTLWYRACVGSSAKVCGKRLKHWLNQDGNSQILLAGETVYRHIVIKD